MDDNNEAEKQLISDHILGELPKPEHPQIVA